MANHNQEEQEKIVSDQEILWKILHSVEKIDATLIGTAYTNNKGLVHKVEEHGVAIEGIDKRLREVELGAKTEEKLEKKSHSFWAVAASVVAAIVSFIAFVFSFKK
jgi:hypothetical protein